MLRWDDDGKRGRGERRVERERTRVEAVQISISVSIISSDTISTIGTATTGADVT